MPPTESSHTAPEGSDTGSAARPPRAKVIRTPRLALLGVVVLLLGVFLFFVGAPALTWWLLVLPVLVAIWVLRTQTTVSATGLDLRTVFSSRHLDWEQIRGLRIPRRGFVRVHLDDDSEVKLPAVGYDRLRDLIVASDGRIPDPFAAAEEAEQREWEQRQAEKAAEAEKAEEAEAADTTAAETGTGTAETGSTGSTGSDVKSADANKPAADQD